MPSSDVALLLLPFDWCCCCRCCWCAAADEADEDKTAEEGGKAAALLVTVCRTPYGVAVLEPVVGGGAPAEDEGGL